ncbi:glycoside hydrolase family 3 protein [Tessaracoccus coleopterorum]|uniref:glycoside hydrolase family 3 protein n=1 Tax=Tessaracoccus coleopterorum TaxID=2714950 RepID=UPI001E5CFC81|nr:glycoside hydrolase family 3 C-terminal domain-containing protein [Tessaracoccus coleopterorum]
MRPSRVATATPARSCRSTSRAFGSRSSATSPRPPLSGRGQFPGQPDPAQRRAPRTAGHGPAHHRLRTRLPQARWPSEKLRDKAVRLAARADVVVAFIGLDEAAETEGLDRADMRLRANQLDLMRELTALDTRIVVVLVGGAPVELPFIDDVDAVLHAYLGGQGGGEAIARLLTGRRNPSGRLAESYPIRGEDAPPPLVRARRGHRRTPRVDLRRLPLLRRGRQARAVPFGHGLSYTTFTYSDLSATQEGLTVTVTNTGAVEGEEVVQAYVSAHRTDSGHPAS